MPPGPTEAWTNDDLDRAWGAVPNAGTMSFGVTHHADDDRPWVAWSRDDAGTWGPEGWGDRPIRTIRALGSAHRQAVGWWAITVDDEVGKGP